MPLPKTMAEVMAHNARVAAGQVKQPGAVALKAQTANAAPGIATAGKRIRQDSKPLMNHLEASWFNVIACLQSFDYLRAQSKRFKLGNGIWYKPDMTAINTVTRKETAWEVKGPFAHRGGLENLKVAASLYPEITWILCWKANGEWKTQEVLA